MCCFIVCFEIVPAKTTLVDLNFRYAASVGGISASSLWPILRLMQTGKILFKIESRMINRRFDGGPWSVQDLACSRGFSVSCVISFRYSPVLATLLYILAICSYAISGADFISSAEILSFPGLLLFFRILIADFILFVVNFRWSLIKIWHGLSVALC